MEELEARIKKLEHVIKTMIIWNVREYGVKGVDQLLNLIEADPKDVDGEWIKP